MAGRLVLAGAAALLALTLAFNLHTGLSTDVAYYVASARRILAGAQPYVDILETNPPIGFWVAVPPVALANAVGLSAATGYLLGVTAAVAAVLWLLWRMVRAAQWTVAACVSFTLAAAAATTIGTFDAFGQREHFSALLLLPWLTTMVMGLRGETATGWQRVAAGLCAGVAICFKPYVAAVVAVAALYRLAVSPNRRWLMERAMVLMLVPMALYPLLIRLFTPTYLSDTLPLVLETYGAFNAPWLIHLARWQSLVFVPLWLFAAIATRRDGDRVAGLWLAAALGGVVSYLVQHKAIPYHTLPALCFLMMALMRAGSEIRRPALRRFGVVLVALVSLLGWTMFARTQAAREAALDQLLAGRTPHSLMMLTSDIGAGFPYVENRSITWVGRTAAFWMMQAVGLHRLDAERAAAITRQAAALAAEDLAREAPEMVLVDQRMLGVEADAPKADFLTWFAIDPRFVTAFSAYERAAEADGFVLYQRQQ